MTYIENAFVCIAAPLLVAALCAGRRHLRPFLFSLAGMLACLLSAYVNTFFAAALNASALDATAEIAPVVEEMMKLLPPALLSAGVRAGAGAHQGCGSDHSRRLRHL